MERTSETLYLAGSFSHFLPKHPINKRLSPLGTETSEDFGCPFIGKSAREVGGKRPAIQKLARDNT